MSSIQITDRGQPSLLVTDLSGADIKDQSDTDPLILQTFGDLQALLEDSKDEFKDESDEEMYKAREKMDDETQPPPNDPQPTKEERKFSNLIESFSFLDSNIVITILLVLGFLRVLFDSLMDDANNANVGMYVSRSACFGGEELLRSVSKRSIARMNKMTRKGDSKVNLKVSTGLDSENAQPRMAIRGSLNTNYGNPNSGCVDTNLGGNSEYLSLVKHSNVPRNDRFQPGFEFDGTRNASSIPV
ncbi:hypothetical protein Tco_1250589, partial [Tanacetum coccineum]